MPASHGLVSSGDYTRLRWGTGRRVGGSELHSFPRVGLMWPRRAAGVDPQF